MTDNTYDANSGNIQIASAYEIVQESYDFIVDAGNNFMTGMTASAASYTAACMIGLGSAASYLAGGTMQSMPAAAGAMATGVLTGNGFANFCAAIGQALSQFPTIADPAPIGVAGFSDYGAMLNAGGTISFGDVGVGIDSSGNILF